MIRIRPIFYQEQLAPLFIMKELYNSKKFIPNSASFDEALKERVGFYRKHFDFLNKNNLLEFALLLPDEYLLKKTIFI